MIQPKPDETENCERSAQRKRVPVIVSSPACGLHTQFPTTSPGVESMNRSKNQIIGLIP